MSTRWMKAMIGGVLLFSLTACAESVHQTQRMTMLGQAPENGYADVYDQASPFYSNPGFWWSPFAYYPGFSGYGPGYRSGYPNYYPRSGYLPGGSFSNPGGSSPRPSPPANAPPQFFKRK